MSVQINKHVTYKHKSFSILVVKAPPLEPVGSRFKPPRGGFLIFLEIVGSITNQIKQKKTTTQPTEWSSGNLPLPAAASRRIEAPMEIRGRSQQLRPLHGHVSDMGPASRTTLVGPDRHVERSKWLEGG